MKIIDVLREEAARGGFTVYQVLAKDHRARVCKLRQYAMWRARNETGRSWRQIGAVFKRDHTTVKHDYRIIEAMTPEQRLALPAPPPPERPPRRPTVFYQGRDCALQHGGRRYATTGKCVECKRITDKRKHHDKMDARTRRGDSTFSCVAAE